MKKSQLAKDIESKIFKIQKRKNLSTLDKMIAIRQLLQEEKRNKDEV